IHDRARPGHHRRERAAIAARRTPRRSRSRRPGTFACLADPGMTARRARLLLTAANHALADLRQNLVMLSGELEDGLALDDCGQAIGAPDGVKRALQQISTAITRGEAERSRLRVLPAHDKDASR